jgi:hypothetical protein
MTPDFDPRRWRKSKHSGDNGGCVELNFTVPGWAGVRDSTMPARCWCSLSRI